MGSAKDTGLTAPELTSGSPRSSSFALLVASFSIAEIGSYIMVAMVPLIAATVLHANPLQMGFLATASTIPYLLFGPLAGVVADRVAKRRILVATDIARTAALLGGFLAATTGNLGYLGLYLLAFCMGAGSVWYDITHGSYLPSVVSRSRLLAANSCLSMSESAAYTLGPVLAGLLVQWAGVAPSLLVPSILFVLSAALLRTLGQGRPIADQPRRSVAIDMREGLVFICTHTLLRKLTLRHMAWHFVVGGAYSLGVLYLVGTLGLSAVATGWLLAAMGVGTLVAALCAQKISRRLGVGRSIMVSNLLAAGGAGLMITFPPGTAIAVAASAVALFCYGFCTILYQVNNASLRQAITPDVMLGRMTAAVRVSTYAINAIGAVIGGLLAQFIGVRTALACLFAIAVLAALRGCADRVLMAILEIPRNCADPVSP